MDWNEFMTACIVDEWVHVPFAREGLNLLLSLSLKQSLFLFIFPCAEYYSTKTILKYKTYLFAFLKV